MARTTSGTELTLRSGDYTARVVTVGAGLAGLTLAGRDLTIPHSADELPEGYLGKVLVPWPNRIAGGAYSWRGTRQKVPVNEPDTGSALHGLMTWVDWRVVHSDRDSATLGAFVAPRYGYPWPLETWVTYALEADSGLTVTLSSTNVGHEAAPYGVSMHPYLCADGAPVDACEITVPAASVLEVDARMAPVALHPVGDLGLDLRSPTPLSGRSVDHAFTGLPAGGWEVRLHDPHTGTSVVLGADTPWVQVYTGERLGRRGVAVEPMTCPPDAFNSGTDVIVLDPGASHSLTFAIRGEVD